MYEMIRRVFLSTGASATLIRAAGGTGAVGRTLASGIAQRRIPAVVAMAASSKKTLYAGAFGLRDSSGPPVGVDSIFQIASMTKAITTVAALQLVEQGKVELDAPVSRYLPQFEKLDMLDGFDAGGRPKLRPAHTAPTLRHLLTHTSGLGYDTWDGGMFRYMSGKPAVNPAKAGVLLFEPGKRWQYGQGIDWAGRLVEKISGQTLEAYFQEKIFLPLGMTDTSFIVQAAKFDRLVSLYARDAGGELRQAERKLPAPPRAFNGGGGLFSTAGDYVRFLQMILNGGRGPGGARILQSKTVASMRINQIGEATAGKMKSYKPEMSSDVDVHPGHTEKWGLGFLINTTAYEGGRSAGSLAWAGLFNTFYWIDPKRDLCGVILMQFLPFVDKEAVGLLNDFERAIYQARLD